VLFYPEDESDGFLRSFGNHLLNYTASQHGPQSTMGYYFKIDHILFLPDTAKFVIDNVAAIRRCTVHAICKNPLSELREYYDIIL
jgi:hypothetical protein